MTESALLTRAALDIMAMQSRIARLEAENATLRQDSAMLDRIGVACGLASSRAIGRNAGRPRKVKPTPTTGAAIIAARIGAGVSKRTLAHRSGLGRAYIAMAEDGAVEPTAEELGRIAAALGLG